MQRAIIFSALLSLPGVLNADSPFVRGDVNANGVHELTDAMQLFGHLFRGERGLPCLDAADVDATGDVQLTDGIYLLDFLFLGGPQPPEPFSSCGAAGEGVLGCESFDACGGDTSISIHPKKELMIIDLSVVEDPCRTGWTAQGCGDGSRGAWTFGKLMASLAGLRHVDENPRALSRFVVDWLRQMNKSRLVNGIKVEGRPGVEGFVESWARISGFDGANDPDLVLDMRRAPFRLLSIVSRLDLRRSASDGSTLRGGEGRFVFCALSIDPRAPGDPVHWRPLPATVIFEYSLAATSPREVIDWSQRWHALGSLPFGEQYNRALQEITDDFAGPGLDADVPGGSSLSQLRTNEVAFGYPWELREFHLRDVDPSPVLDSSDTVRLVQAPVAQTVDLGLDGTERLSRFVNANSDLVRRGEHVVPLEFEGRPFLAGSAFVPSKVFGWTVPTYDCDEPRHQLSLNTCNGCHGGETGTAFVHVGPRRAGRQASLSAFLGGVSVRDPVCDVDESVATTGVEPVREFHDLERRARDLRGLLRIGATRTAHNADIGLLFLGLEPHRGPH